MVPEAKEIENLDLIGKAKAEENFEDSQVVLRNPKEEEESMKLEKGCTGHQRYSSPLFQNLLGKPIEPVKISKRPLSIPDDDSINNLIQTASLVSKSQKAPLVESEHLTPPPTNISTNESSEEAVDEFLFQTLSVSEKRPSVQDPEKVLMENVVPGEMIKNHVKSIESK